ncbi:hypothetical protein GCM10010112_13630 [Actinoplanes lobatus]|uniref:Uncharacterized protein n=1 Tax=Actinoplanes lobatus TaxID=113568 RepID=A0A7W7HMF1_9ACTN|nr:hypothetical protein [Actinoplanes lobatus]MBB4753200.1 hypothetical protein [Actinoplanes lobatus]GGN59096.1 hypothetical protein GCM10010112_13630 [Actinoplanes lobatus]GIE42940.1 hypothetical protein Alo02nite_58380 [Actinoplanes lobatus]
MTFRCERVVLVVVRTVTALTRLLDVVSLIAADRRVQILFTVDGERAAVFGDGVRPALAGIAPRMIPWEQARTGRFDLVLSASENDGLAEIDGPALVLPHGLGFQKFYPGGRTVAGLDPERLKEHDRVIALSHPGQRKWMSEGRDRAVVVGDPCWSRMRASRHRRDTYRAAFGAEGRRLVVLASTWGPESLLGAAPGLPEKLVAELPMDEYRIVAVLHPGIWAAHGPWQVRAWLARADVRVPAPDSDWQAALLAADCVIADHGSAAGYAALAGVPVLLGPRGSATTVPGSIADHLAQRCPRIGVGLRSQIDTAGPPELEPPMEAAAPLRSLLYSLMDLAEPSSPAEFPPLPVPGDDGPTIGAWVAGETANIERYPDIGFGAPHDELSYRHTVARVEHCTLTQAEGATIIGGASLDDWPRAHLSATVDGNTCVIRTRDGHTTALNGDDPTIDPWLLASWAYIRLRRGEPLNGAMRLGGRVITVRAEAD